MSERSSAKEPEIISSSLNTDTSQQIDIYLNFNGDFSIPTEAIPSDEEAPEEREPVEKRAGYRRKDRRRKELAALRTAETQSETIQEAEKE